jgi:tetratricopeptide (TPR) repeat protein
MYQDRYGLPLTAASEAAAASYREGLDLILSAWTGAGEVLDRAIAEDPTFALACIARARVHQIYAEATDARARAAQARTLAENITRRERQHIEIIARAVEGQPASALTAAEQHLNEFPRDALVLSLLLGAFGLYAFSGRADHDVARVAICERHARHYGEDWWFLTYLGWAHTEGGNAAVGRTITERAITLREKNGNAAHALAHALFEQGDAVAGGSFLNRWLPTYDGGSFLNGHLSWHLALVALDSNDIEGAIKIYQERIHPGTSHSPPLNYFTDTASFLWRVGLVKEVELGPYWREVAAYASRRFPQAGVHFADVHWALVAAATNSEDLHKRLTELEALQANGKLAPGQSAIELCRGVQAFASGDYEAAARIFEAYIPELSRIGGSHAQREMFEDTLLVAYLRSGYAQKARNLIDRRLHRRPSTRDEMWRTQVQQG